MQAVVVHDVGDSHFAQVPELVLQPSTDVGKRGRRETAP